MKLTYLLISSLDYLAMLVSLHVHCLYSIAVTNYETSTAPNVYENLMEEDSKTAKLREQLRGEMDKLSQAMSSIVELEFSSNSGTSSDTAIPARIDLDDEMDDGV